MTIAVDCENKPEYKPTNTLNKLTIGIDFFKKYSTISHTPSFPTQHVALPIIIKIFERKYYWV